MTNGTRVRSSIKDGPIGAQFELMPCWTRRKTVLSLHDGTLTVLTNKTNGVVSENQNLERSKVANYFFLPVRNLYIF
jgi:hypothetical protein